MQQFDREFLLKILYTKYKKLNIKLYIFHRIYIYIYK